MGYEVSIIGSLLALAIAGAGTAQEPVKPSPEWVEARIQAWQPTERERRWEQIGWAKDIRTAIRLAKEHNRPVFLFTHDGRLNLGRC